MDIHQMNLRYEPTADRLLWQLRTRTGELFAVWLTRRMLRQLWPPMHMLVTQAGIQQLAPNATVLPEALAMMAQAAQARPLAGADFKTPFDASPAATPLGRTPLLPTQIDLGPGAQGQGLRLALRESSDRQITLQLSDDMARALQRLMAQALNEADWGLGPVRPAQAGAQPVEADTPAAPPLLN